MSQYLGGTNSIYSIYRSVGRTKAHQVQKVFDNSKVTDHHAIIPTGQPPVNLTEMEKRVFDLVARRFIAVFYPDCKFATTTVIGEADSIEFKATGKQILDPGWRVIFAKPQTNLPEGMTDPDAEARENDEEHSLPAFVKGESGPHLPKLDEKWTQPPRPYTEATLLRAMETAGKLVDNDELRDALKENGIGRRLHVQPLLKPYLNAIISVKNVKI